jgi:hypothetical protein
VIELCDIADLVDGKLIKLKNERDQMGGELDKLKSIPSGKPDISSLVSEIMTSVVAFEDIFRVRTLEEKK